MGKTERQLTAATAAIVFAAGLYVVIFAPLMVSEKEDGGYYITDYSFTKGLPEARQLATAYCAEQGLSPSTLEKKKVYKRVQEQFSTQYHFTCDD